MNFNKVICTIQSVRGQFKEKLSTDLGRGSVKNKPVLAGLNRHPFVIDAFLKKPISKQINHFQPWSKLAS